MKYLLDEKEYDELEPKQKREKVEAEVQKALPILLRAVKCFRVPSEAEEKSQSDKSWMRHRASGYCDNCPLRELRLVCTYPRSFSQ